MVRQEKASRTSGLGRGSGAARAGGQEIARQRQCPALFSVAQRKRAARRPSRRCHKKKNRPARRKLSAGDESESGGESDERSGFLMRGLYRQHVRAEFSLTALAYNLRRALNILGVEAMRAAVVA